MVGSVLGVVLTAVGFLAAGAGHGPLVPLLLIEGPLALLRPLADISATVHNIVALVALVATPILYGAYSVYLRREKIVSWRWRVVGLVHLLCSTVSIWQFYQSS